VRVALAVPCFWPALGGTEVLAERLARGLGDRGHEVRVFTTDHAHSHDVGRMHSAHAPLPSGPVRVDGVDVVRLPMAVRLRSATRWGYLPLPGRAYLRRWLRGRARRRFDEDFVRAVRAWAPDVLVTMRASDRPVHAGALARERLGIPLVYSPQTHHEDPTWRVEPVRALAAHSDAVTANTEHEARLLSTVYGVPPERVVRAGCGVDLPPDPGPWPRPPRVLYLGRKAGHKRMELLLEAMATVWERRPDAEVAFVGSRWPDSGRFDAALSRLPADRRARVLEADDVNETEKARWLDSAWCLCLPSGSESFGIVLLEAWAHGTPVVAQDLAVMRSTVRPGGDGLLARPGDAQDLGRTLLALLDDEGLARRLGAEGRRRAGEEFRWDLVADAYERAIAIATR